MRTLFWVLLLFALAVTLSLVAQVSTGLVMFVVPPYRVDISLNAFVLILLGVFPLIYGVLRLLFITLSLPDRVKNYRENRRRQILMRDTLGGVIALFSGRFRKAEKSAQRALESRPDPDVELVNSLVAARAAHYTRNYGARDQHLGRLNPTLHNDSQLAVYMTQAHLANEARDYHGALKAITQARSISPNHTAAMQLELAIRQRMEQPDKVLALLEPLSKAEALPPSTIKHIRLQAYLQQLRTLQLDARQWVSWWQKVPAELRGDSLLAAVACQKFIEMGENGLAAITLVNTLEKEWDDKLVALYGEPVLHGMDGALLKAIQKAEGWLQQHPRDAVLLFTLSRLCRAQKLWGKAQSYAEASLSIKPSASAYLELAELAEQGNNHESASQYIRKALSLSLAS